MLDLASGISSQIACLQAVPPRDIRMEIFTAKVVKRPKMSPFRPLLKCYRQSTHLCETKKVSVASIFSEHSLLAVVTDCPSTPELRPI